MPFPYTFTFQIPQGPNPGVVTFERGPLAQQFERGIKFANVPGGRPEFLWDGGDDRVAHVNSVLGVNDGQIGIKTDGHYSGAVKFRNRDYRKFPVPASVRR